jgi:predicted PurR-regulated permease PerM
MAQQEAQDVRARDGAAAAALLAAVIGIFVLAVMIVVAEANEDFANWLKWDNEVGPLSGKSSLGLIAWAVTWPVLHLLLYRRDRVLMAASAISLVLFVAAMVLMFPPVFDKFAP